jgi:methionyl-tRNA formyltransferase
MMHEFFEDEKPLTVFISGQKYFGEKILSLCIKLGFEVKGVCCPLDDKYIGKTARLWDIPIIPAGALHADILPEGIDLGITAHSFDYIDKQLRYKTRLGWIGYHPSLLPRHRGKSAIEWTLKMRDYITGGTVYWLNAGIDMGDIACQQWCWLDPALYALPLKEASRVLWRKHLLPIGEKLMETALLDLKRGVVKRVKQDQQFATFEPCIQVAGVYRPDRLMLPGHGI